MGSSAPPGSPELPAAPLAAPLPNPHPLAPPSCTQSRPLPHSNAARQHAPSDAIACAPHPTPLEAPVPPRPPSPMPSRRLSPAPLPELTHGLVGLGSKPSCSAPGAGFACPRPHQMKWVPNGRRTKKTTSDDYTGGEQRRQLAPIDDGANQVALPIRLRHHPLLHRLVSLRRFLHLIAQRLVQEQNLRQRRS
ncbi:hypothetical protein PR202_gb23901 [Eleusine coracana subsp. coracana]|uniref:Uncharacterized protein n=1 Tax=Eleusine coracana subsp. coracana TaxID=191504 RepID=A0AAV5FKN1_ELECO|nr:hypothetical protein PR202_gb23901 [Eleusine coracana subsp. coracana]